MVILHLSEQELKIKVFAHWAGLYGADKVALEQINRIRNSGLMDNIDQFYICINGDLTQFLNSVSALQEYKNIRFIIKDDVSVWEYPTLTFLHQQCQLDTEDSAVFYYHLKGLSRPNAFATDWRRFLEYWNIDNWRACYETLQQGYDTVGVNYTRSEDGIQWPHYSGNIWWARSSYIKKLRSLPDPKKPATSPVSEFTGYTYAPHTFRFDHEAWIGSGKPKYFEIAESPGKGYTGFHYHNPYPEHLYKL